MAVDHDIGDRTAHRSYELPHPDAIQREDVERLARTIIALDLDVSDLLTALAGKASPADIDARIDALVAGAPAALDTLQELATALQGNDDAIAALTSAIAAKADASDLSAHEGRHDNPHGVTAAQLGAALADASNMGGRLGALAKYIPGCDWDTVTESGWYRAAATTNNPLGSDGRWWMGWVIYHGGAGWGFQHMWDFANTNTHYERARRGGTWQPWVKVSASNHRVLHPDNATIADIAGLQSALDGKEAAGAVVDWSRITGAPLFMTDVVLNRGSGGDITLTFTRSRSGRIVTYAVTGTMNNCNCNCNCNCDCDCCDA